MVRYLRGAFLLEELSLLNIWQGNVREFFLPHLVALCHWGHPPYIYIHEYIYIYIYTTSTPPFQSPARCLPLAEGARTGYKPTRRNNDSLQLTWMRQTAQTKKRIVQRETQSEHWQNQFEELQANTAERIKKAVTTAKDNDNKATEQLSQVSKVRAESEMDQLKVAVEMPFSMITGTKCS